MCRRFLELTSVFVDDPLVRVRHGRAEIGQMPDLDFATPPANRPGSPAILLAERA